MDCNVYMYIDLVCAEKFLKRLLQAQRVGFTSVVLVKTVTLISDHPIFKPHCMLWLV